MGWFNTYPRDEERSLTRVVSREVSLREVPLSSWTQNELGLRLAVLYPKVDGNGHLTASDEVKTEIDDIRAELTTRGLDWSSNLRRNENFRGRGWQSGFQKLERENEDG